MKRKNVSKQIDFNNLVYHFKAKKGPGKFTSFRDLLNFFKDIIDGYTTLEKAKENQKKLNQI